MEKYESILIKNGFLLTMQGEGVGSIIDGAVAIEGQDIVACFPNKDINSSSTSGVDSTTD